MTNVVEILVGFSVSTESEPKNQAELLVQFCDDITGDVIETMTVSMLPREGELLMLDRLYRVQDVCPILGSHADVWVAKA